MFRSAELWNTGDVWIKIIVVLYAGNFYNKLI